MAPSASRRRSQRPRKFYTELKTALLDYAEAEFRLNKKQKDGYTLRQHYEQYLEQTGTNPDELRIPEFPNRLGHVLSWFGDLCERRGGSGFGVNPISYSEMQAYFNFKRLFPTDFELECLIELDNTYMRTICSDGI